jgi:hypothetical protein
MFQSAIRSTDDFAGVFEFDGDTGYFYLCRVAPSGEPHILEAIPVSFGEPDYTQDDVVVRWSGDELVVSVMIGGEVRAAFDCDTRANFGGIDKTGAQRPLTAELLARLTP